MKLPRSMLALLCLSGLVLRAENPPEGFASLFNGKDLAGWSGQEGNWSVEDGVITGITSEQHPLKQGNSFLIWQGGELADFELRVKARWPARASNSGIQFRSQAQPKVGPYSIAGYQYDLNWDGGLSGTLYHERGRGGLCGRGQKVTIGEDGKRAIERFETPDIKTLNKVDDWNEARILAVGERVEAWFNGEKMFELIDRDPGGRALKGLLALQLHVGPPMKVQFKDLWLRRIPAGTPGEAGAAGAGGASGVKPLKVLLITGGCCHDYTAQKSLIAEGLKERAHVEVEVIEQGGRATNSKIPLYENKDWAKGFDVVVHDECFADVKDPAWLETILAPHRAGTPAVNLHCAMHCYRWGDFGKPVAKGADNAHWFEFVGMQSSGHGPQQPIELSNVAPTHPILDGFENWTTGNEELYNNVQTFDTSNCLIRGKQGKSEVWVAWEHLYKGKTRVFSTTLAHNNKTIGDPRYLDLVTRAVLWSADKLNPAYLKPRPPKTSSVAPPARPNLAVAGIASASSEQPGNDIGNANDGETDTRWCASDGSAPQWWAVDLGEPRAITGVELVWESTNNAYRYRLEGSNDGKQWTPLADRSANRQPGRTEDPLAAKTRHVRVSFLGSSAGGWGSIREARIFGEPGAPQPAPRKKAQGARTPEAAGEPPALETLLKDLRVADGFEGAIFATPEQANYPVFVTAAPDGTLFVSSDGNGSIGRDAHRGRVLRLRDTDGDGRADEVKVFVPDVDSPRGLVWDGDRLYLLHPPHISVYEDKDRDGVADGEKVLIRNIAFTFKDRPADHTTNGLKLGVDGWLYVACGDFGFLEAEGTDGRKLQLRGGGIVRFRPDGSGLELFSYGTRNIVEAAWSPLLDGFTRDNTNDGGGWDLRLHHFSGLEDHGYPKLFKNFAAEIVPPLADYGGGSGCGACWIDEPGMPAGWNNLPYTSDWGRGPIFRHTVRAKGATFEETEAPAALATVTRSTDLDVDARCNIYVSSWRGGQFNWAGPHIGYIARVRPKGYTAPPVPDFDRLTNAQRLALLESPSQRLRHEAQRSLLRAGLSAQDRQALLALASDAGKPLASRVIALFTVALAADAETPAALAKLLPDATLAPWTLRALGDLADRLQPAQVEALRRFLASEDARTRREAIFALARAHGVRGFAFDDGVTTAHTPGHPALAADTATAIVPLLADADPVVAHTAFQALAQLRADAVCLAALDKTDAPTGLRDGLAKALGRMHTPAAVSGLLERLDREKDGSRRRHLLTALTRLYHREGVWKGASWGTRPDTRGPYYQPETWEHSPRIGAALQAAIAMADAAEAAFISEEMARNRIQLGDALGRLLKLAESDASVLPALARQLATAESVPEAAVPALVRAAATVELGDALRAMAVQALAKADSEAGLDAALQALADIAGSKTDGVEVEKARNALLNSSRLENHHSFIEKKAANGAGQPQLWATALLLKMSQATAGAPEAREMTGRALDALWKNPAGRRQVMDAALLIRDASRAEWFVQALDDGDAAVAAKARQTIESLRINVEKLRAARQGPLVASLPVPEVIAQVAKLRGDARRGEVLYTQQGCVACHTTEAGQPLKGPYLGNIATTYPRMELAEHILVPGKSLAQGFVSTLFTLQDGTSLLGFVTLESADQVAVRDITARETLLKPSQIVKREKVETSLMPPGLANSLTLQDFASLLDYLEALAAAKK